MHHMRRMRRKLKQMGSTKKTVSRSVCLVCSNETNFDLISRRTPAKYRPSFLPAIVHAMALKTSDTPC